MRLNGESGRGDKIERLSNVKVTESIRTAGLGDSSNNL